MNKAQRMELAELAKKFSKSLPNKKDTYEYDRYSWDRFGDAFFDWLGSQKHSFNVENLLELMVAFREKLPSGDDWDYDEGWCTDRQMWEELYTKFVKFCIGK